jgi:hypothetical protein
MSNMEVMTFKDKEARDRAFEDLRGSDLPNERAVVKFSDCEIVLSGHAHGEISLDGKNRVRYISTFSLAYPRQQDEQKTKRRDRKDRQIARQLSEE